MKTFRIKGVHIGSGMPKICAAMTGKTKKEILAMAEDGEKSPAPLLEWRCDHYIFASGLAEQCAVADTAKVRKDIEDMVAEIRNITEKPLLLTLRTLGEGGALSIGKREYYTFVRDFVSEADRGKPDIMDIEAFDGDEGFDEEKVRFIVSVAKENGIGVLLSHHNVSGTYNEEEIRRRMQAMDSLGADMTKMIIKAETKEDMYGLMAAAKSFGESEATVPYSAFAMGEAGVESRVCGQSIGSALSFSFIGEPSAPGQIPVEELDRYIREYGEREGLSVT